jgi:perosamine synthetase
VFVPVSEPRLSSSELENVTNCVKSGWVSSAGQYITEFEESWAQYCGRRHGISVSNGTVALQLAVRCLDLAPGDEIIMPTFTIVSCAQAAIYNGLIPVLVDADPATWCLDVSRVEAKISRRTRAIMPVHTYGHPVDMDPILDLARHHELHVIEDAAEAHGAEYLSRATGSEGWRRCGSFGDLSVFSFYANKIVTTGEGGMLLTDSEVYSSRAERLRNLAFLPEQRFLHHDLGFNFRMTNLQAALGAAQVSRVSESVTRKREIARRYQGELADVPGVSLPVEQPWARNVYWMFGLVLDNDVPMDARQLAHLLRARGVETRPFFLGMHAQPALLRMGLFRGERYPVADRLAQRGLYLPSGLAITDEQINYVACAVREALA